MCLSPCSSAVVAAVSGMSPASLSLPSTPTVAYHNPGSGNLSKYCFCLERTLLVKQSAAGGLVVFSRERADGIHRALFWEEGHWNKEGCIRDGETGPVQAELFLPAPALASLFARAAAGIACLGLLLGCVTVCSWSPLMLTQGHPASCAPLSLMVWPRVHQSSLLLLNSHSNRCLHSL